MLARREGLTTTYNRFHEPHEVTADIEQLRAMQVKLDRVVAAAYDWADLDLAHGFYETRQGMRFTISERAGQEVLARLLALNHERYAEEARRGVHERTESRLARDDEEEPAQSVFSEGEQG